MTLRLSLPLALVALSLFAGCSKDPEVVPAAQGATAQGASATSPKALPDRDPALARKLVAEGGVLLDVRSPDEFSGGHIDGAKNIPVEDLEGRMGDVEKLTGGDKKKPIVVYCASGARSKFAKKMLVKAGYEMVTNLGPMSNWR
jgi:rhodanese-related sulfurtransferase